MELSPEVQQKLRNFFVERSRLDQQQKVERYRRLNKFVKPGQILFVGSSLMEQFPINELAMDLNLPYIIYNRGIGGYTTTDLQQVLDVCVYDLKPKHIFINIGTNDLNAPDYSLESLMQRYENILQSIKENLPEARLHLMAYYPVNEPIGLADPFMGGAFKLRTNKRIREANEAVKALAEKMGGKYYDFNSGITDADGNQKAEYTIEGMHIYGDGYMEVLQQMLPVLKELD
jgi:lysophospholipase L1-like esterase